MQESLPDRKRRHLDVCLDESLDVESSDTGLDRIRLPHRAVPSVNPEDVDITTDFLGTRLKMPVMISCMTGGTDEGHRLNRLLAEIAGRRGLALGTGSFRVMLRHPETMKHFHLKTLAPEVPVLANIGAAQLAEYSPQQIQEAARRIEADGLYIHLNPAQELFQDGGDTGFRTWWDDISRLMDSVDIPVLFKETGAGIPPVEGLRLLRMGASYVDIAGAGGTDWIAVEAYKADGNDDSGAMSFRGWGYPTAELLWSYRIIASGPSESGRAVQGRIISSGGLRSPRDFAVSLACGAHLGAAALPFIRRAHTGGPEAVDRYIDDIETGLRAAVVLSGVTTMDEFRILPAAVPADIAVQAELLAEEALPEGRLQ